MATPLSAAQMKTALKREGVEVVEYRSWETHERDDETGLHFGPVNGVMIHHTVTSGTDGSVSLCYNGRSDLPGPLCHAVSAKDGRVFLVSNGRANHAGSGDDDVLRAVVNESYGSTPPAPNEQNTDGNDRFYGIECINLGNGRDPWPEVQVDAMARWAAAICRAHGWSEKSVIGHKEWTNQKIDPRPSTGGADVSMPAFRARVKALLANPPGDDVPIVTNPQEDDVPQTVGRTDDGKKTRAPGEWKALSIDGVDLVKGAQAYSVQVKLNVTAAAGGTLQGRFYHYRPDGSRWIDVITERTTTAGKSFVDFSGTGEIKKDESLRFELAYFPARSGDTAEAVITRSRVRGLYWKA